MDATTETCPTPPAGLRIVRATDDDAELLCELICELAVFEQLHDQCWITPDAVRQHLVGPTRSAEALIAWLEDAPVGFAVYYRTFSTFAARPGIFLEDLFVRSRFRRQGIGRQLLTAVGRIARHANAGRLEWTTLKWNENARRLYASLGAREKGEWLLLRMEDDELAAFDCGGPGHPHAGCHCGGKGAHHAGTGGCGC
jgi:GNAT superfamily N-acetyltransferase